MERIYELIQQSKDGSQEAKTTLIEENSGLIWKIVRRFHGFGVDTEDLFQIGAIGLLKCIEKFDFSFGVKFSTYAVPMIIGEIRRFLRDDGTIKVSRSLKELAVRAKKMQLELEQKENREITIQELSKAVGVTVEELVLALESKRELESLNAPTSYDEDTQIQDKLPAKENADFVVNKLCLMQAMEILEEKEKQIILLRYFKDCTQTQIAERMGISQVQVSRIEKKVLQQLRVKIGEWE
ncbi:MAG: SigB/SigF/SigG family RNA polymerase sigma factor [Bacillota bacterium]